jgi:ribosomal protein L22
LDTLINTELELLDKTITHYDAKFSTLIKDYKNYLKMASKGIQKQEREIKKEASKLLKQSLENAKKNLDFKKS